jgi:hypothetical protein
VQASGGIARRALDRLERAGCAAAAPGEVAAQGRAQGSRLRGRVSQAGRGRPGLCGASAPRSTTGAVGPGADGRAAARVGAAVRGRGSGSVLGRRAQGWSWAWGGSVGRLVRLPGGVSGVGPGVQGRRSVCTGALRLGEEAGRRE